MFFHPEIETEDSVKSEQSLVVEISTQTEVGSGRKNLLTRLNLFGKVIEASVTTTNEFFRCRNCHFQPTGIKLTAGGRLSGSLGHGLSIAVKITHLAYFHFDNFPSPMFSIF